MARSSPLVEEVLNRHLTALGRALPLAAEGDVEALHKARVATRRLREALSPFADDGAARRGVQHDIRRITRVLGPVRELDVALQNLDELEAAGQREVVRSIREALSAERMLRQRDVRKAIARIDTAKIASRTLRLVRLGGKASARGRHLDIAWKQVARRASKLESEIERTGDAYAPARLHKVRIAVKKLRYALESVAALRGTRMLAGVNQLKETQDLLGRLHDLQVLTARVLEIGKARQEAVSARSTDLDILTDILQHECRRLHADYLARRGTILLVCSRARRASRGHAKGRS